MNAVQSARSAAGGVIAHPLPPIETDADPFSMLVSAPAPRTSESRCPMVAARADGIEAPDGPGNGWRAGASERARLLGGRSGRSPSPLERDASTTRVGRDSPRRRPPVMNPSTARGVALQPPH